MRIQFLANMPPGHLFRNLKIDFGYIFFQISKLHFPSFYMNQLVCPTDISSGVGGCAKMCLEKGVEGLQGAAEKAGGWRGVGVNFR